MVSTLFKFKRIFLRRLFNRIKTIFYLKEMWTWEYESCDRCGSCFKIAYSVKNELWKKVYGNQNGCWCLNCFIEKAIEKGIEIKKEDFEWLCLFGGNKFQNDIVKFKER